MGILGKMALKAAVKVAGDIAIKSTDGHLKKTRSVNAITNKSEAKYKLFMELKGLSIKRGFNVYDESHEIKYVVKTDWAVLRRPSIRLYDTEGDEIGKVESASRTDLGKYYLYEDGGKTGTLSSNVSLTPKFDLSLNDWHLDANFWQNSFVVTDRSGREIMKFDEAYTFRDTYVLQLDDRNNEIPGLLLVMAMELSHHRNDD